MTGLAEAGTGEGRLSDAEAGRAAGAVGLVTAPLPAALAWPVRPSSAAVAVAAAGKAGGGAAGEAAPDWLAPDTL